ncbi:MAG: hypothetical protein HKM24_01760, partial [Gammaproteobacteria bacterium]|nr:hypothetical protein [Gammaproteobacteria bacterium]
VQINGASIGEDTFADVFLNDFLPLVRKSRLSPTYFEVLMAFSYWYFARTGVDVAVIETGLGGLLDGSNVVTRSDKTCVITDIGYDHTEILGHSLSEIAQQKAGIIQPGNETFMLQQSKEVTETIRDYANSQKATVTTVSADEQRYSPDHLFLFQQRNWSLAANTAQQWLESHNIVFPDDNKLQQAAHIDIPARIEVLTIGNKTVVLDGAHNPQKLSALAESFKEKFGSAPFAMLLSCIKSKQQKLLSNLQAVSDLKPAAVVTTYFQSNQDLKKEATDPKQLAEQLTTMGVENVQAISDSELALKTLLDRPEDLLLITGSLYLIFEIRPLLIAMKTFGEEKSPVDSYAART